MMNEQRNLLVVSGPSGCGKDTVVAKMIGAHAGVERSVSATTRPMRRDEVQGVDYFFLTRAEFEQRIQEGGLVEYAEYVGNYYGTLRSQLEERMAQGVTCVLVIEVQGAANIKQQYPECTTVFILPPSMEELERRLRGRASESEERVQRRLLRAVEEMKHANSYDYRIVNHDADDCAEELYAILQKRRQQPAEAAAE